MPTRGCGPCPKCQEEGRESRGFYVRNPTLRYYTCPNNCIEPQDEPGECPQCHRPLALSLLPLGLKEACICQRHGIYAASDVPSIRELLEEQQG